MYPVRDLKNLTAAEDRIRKLEAAFLELLPNVNVDVILNSSSYNAPRAPDQSEAASTEKREDAASSAHVNLRESAFPGAEETLPQQPDGFDWVEETTLSGLSDGMAALSIKPEGTGYLGATSSVMPLRTLLTGDLSVESSNGLPTSSITSRINPVSLSFPNPSAPLSRYSEQVFIDAYFRYYHTTYPFLHEATFRAQYAGQIPRPRGPTWPILLNTVLALGAWNIGGEDSTMDDTFYHTVTRLSQDTSVFEFGNLALVQALLLLSNYTQKRNKPNTGWNYVERIVFAPVQYLTSVCVPVIT